MKIVIGNDHNGVNLKLSTLKKLKELNYEIIDMGSQDLKSVDYPLIAKSVAEEVLKSEDNKGILLCGTGIGMSIAANKIKGIRCAKVDNKEEAYLSRLHNNANVISVSSKKSEEEILEIILEFLNTKFLNEERHVRRNNQIDNL